MKTRQIRRKIIELEASISNSARRASKKQILELAKLKRLIETETLGLASTKLANPASFVVAMKQTEIANLVRNSFAALSTSQQEQMVSHLSNIYTKARIEVSSSLGQAFDTTNQYQLAELLNRTDSGLTLSNRIWRNNQVIGDRVNNDIARLLYNGASPEDIKRALAADFNISYNSADRLIRTETSKFYNAATVDSYKDAGVVEVEWLTEEDDRNCDECGSRDGKKYNIQNPPSIPAHPNCRCVLLPVIE